MSTIRKQIRKEVWFSGRVQGVGFRYTCRQIATEFEVSGTVQNLADGRVHLIAEGDEREVEPFIGEISDQMRSYIHEINPSEPMEVVGYRGFEII
ncbi:MAG: acylphosphatase [Verrucomicrobiota bacterium]